MGVIKCSIWEGSSRAGKDKDEQETENSSKYLFSWRKG
jgi:hypothetical protein